MCKTLKIPSTKDFRISVEKQRFDMHVDNIGKLSVQTMIFSPSVLHRCLIELNYNNCMTYFCAISVNIELNGSTSVHLISCISTKQCHIYGSIIDDIPVWSLPHPTFYTSNNTNFSQANWTFN